MPDVKKIINNGNFIAHLAPELVVVSAQKSVRVAAAKLGRRANIYAGMLAGLGVTVEAENDWGGCDQAKLLLQWIDDADRDDSADADHEIMHKVSLMDKWTVETMSAIADLAAGKLPE